MDDARLRRAGIARLSPGPCLFSAGACVHRSVRGCGGAQVDGGSLARTRMGGRDGFVVRERSRIHWGNGLRRRFFAQLVWRMRAANISPAAGCARACEGCWRFGKWEDANQRRAAPAVSPLGVQCLDLSDV